MALLVHEGTRGLAPLSILGKAPGFRYSKKGSEEERRLDVKRLSSYARYSFYYRKGFTSWLYMTPAHSVFAFFLVAYESSSHSNMIKQPHHKINNPKYSFFTK